MTDVLISVHPRFAASILAGSKQVEIRKRPLRVASGARLWIYCTRPVGRIVAVAEVESSKEGDPDEVWKEIANLAGMSKGEYMRYVNGASRIVAIRLRDPRELDGALDLESIRRAVDGFHPPQFAKRLTNGPLLTLLRKAHLGE